MYLRLDLAEATTYVTSGDLSITGTAGPTELTQFYAGGNYVTPYVAFNGGTQDLTFGGPYSGTLSPGQYIFIFNYEVSSINNGIDPIPTSTGTGTFNVTLTEASAPEPASLGVLGAGASALLLRRRRRINRSVSR